MGQAWTHTCYEVRGAGGNHTGGYASVEGAIRRAKELVLLDGRQREVVKVTVLCVGVVTAGQPTFDPQGT